MKTPTTDDVLHSLGLTRLEPDTAMPDWVAPVAIFGLGALAGAAAAVLLTPKSGPEVRSDIKRTASELTDSVTSALPDLSNPLPGRYGGDNGKARNAMEVEA